MKLQFVYLITVFFFIFLVLTPEKSEANIIDDIIDPIKDCYKQWSRCTKWSSGGNGVLWQKCGINCKCKGYAQGGSCEKVKAECPLSDKAYQCRCKGKKGKPTGQNCGH